MVQLAGEDLKEFVNDIEAFIKGFTSFCNVEIVGCAAVERFKLGIVPEKFWGVEDVAMKIDEVALNEDFPHFAGDLFAG